MVANPERFQIMFLGIIDSANISLEIDDTALSVEYCLKLLYIVMNYELSFPSHVETHCRQAMLSEFAGI